MINFQNIFQNYLLAFSKLSCPGAYYLCGKDLRKLIKKIGLTL